MISAAGQLGDNCCRKFPYSTPRVQELSSGEAVRRPNVTTLERNLLCGPQAPNLLRLLTSWVASLPPRSDSWLASLPTHFVSRLADSLRSHLTLTPDFLFSWLTPSSNFLSHFTPASLRLLTCFAPDSLRLLTSRVASLPTCSDSWLALLPTHSDSWLPGSLRSCLAMGLICWTLPISPSDTSLAKGDKFSLSQYPMNTFKEKEMQKTYHASAVESLMYTQVCRCPGITYITKMLGKYLSNLGLDHWK